MTMPRRLWDAMDNDVLLILWHNGRDAKWIARFMCVNASTIHRRAREIGIVFGRRHRWTAAEDAMLRARYPGERTAGIARELGLNVVQVHRHAAALGLHKNEAFRELDRADHSRQSRTDPRMRAGRFKPGLTPWNKGLRHPKGWAPGRMAQTQFKKGHLSGRAAERVQPIGAERVGKDGILQRKVNNDLPFQRRWKAVQAIVWEEAHGPIPKGCVVVFRDHNRRNFDLSNLELVSWEENMRRNSYHNRYPKEVARLIQLKGALNRKINRRTRKAA